MIASLWLFMHKQKGLWWWGLALMKIILYVLNCSLRSQTPRNKIYYWVLSLISMHKNAILYETIIS
jgi:hypothetical protein